MASASGLSVADMKSAIERMTEAVKAAEAKAEEERAVRTPIAKKASPVSARADEKDKKKESPVSIIAGTPKSTDLIAERKADLGALPSLNALGGKSAAVECEDMIISPLASGMAKDAFITEVTPAASIPAKTMQMWAYITTMMAGRNIDTSKAIQPTTDHQCIPYFRKELNIFCKA